MTVLHRFLGAVFPALALSACGKTLMPFDASSTPVVVLPLEVAGIEDARGRFRDVFCAVLESGRETLPDYRPCDDALTRVGVEPEGPGTSTLSAESRHPLFVGFVPGIGWACFQNWLEPHDLAYENIRRLGFDGEFIAVDALSSSANNAAQIAGWVRKFAQEHAERELVLVGYSKGSPDILRALVDYPDIVGRVAAVVSIAGSVGGSPLANDHTQNQLELMTHWPDADCDEGDERGLESLTPKVRRKWLAENRLPAGVRYYSIVTLPHPDRVSRVLGPSYRQLERIDGRNDGEVLFYDQVIPDSTLLAYVNADHWAVAVPVARSHSTFASIFVEHNDYPREALLEAVLRYIDADL